MQLKSLENAKEYYKSIQKVYCPYFETEVSFNSKGLYHLLHKSGKRSSRRSVKEQRTRLKLLPLAHKAISITTTLQEFDSNSDKVKYWGFIVIMESKKFKVIVRQIGDGKKHFWSIIPNWVTREKSDKKISTC